MLKVFICEDNEIYRKEVEKVIAKVILIENYDMEIKCSTYNSKDILKNINSREETGIYFLDVDLKEEMTGIELGSKIRELDPNGYIIFITTYGEMSYLTFKYKVEALDYIVKEENLNLNKRIKNCLEEVIKRYSIKSENNKVFTVKSKDRIITMEYDEIVFFETSQIIHKIRLHGLHRQVEFYSKMKELENELEKDFIRIHTSFLVNKKMIKEVDKRNRILKMINGEVCLISDSGMKKLKKSNFY